MKAAAFAALLLLLPGCFGGESGGGNETLWSTGPPTLPSRPGCILYACPASGAEDNAIHLREEYGLEMLTYDDRGEDSYTLDGDWIAWIDLSIYGVFGLDVFAMHVPTRTIFPVGMDHRDQILPKLDEGPRSPGKAWTNARIVYEDHRENGTVMVLWTSDTLNHTVLDTGVGGKPRPYALSWPWLAYTVDAATNSSDSGIWAMNLDDGRRFQVYQFLARKEFKDGRTEQFTDLEVRDGYLYYFLDHAYANSNYHNTTITRVNLETGGHRIYPEEGDGAARRGSATPYGLMFDAIPDVFLLNYTTGEITLLASDCSNSMARDRIAVFKCNGDTTVVELDSLERRVLLPMPPRYDVAIGLETTTDGRNVLVECQTNQLENEDDNWSDLCLKRLN